MSSKIKYICVTRCTWANRFWREDDTFETADEKVKPPRHFKLASELAAEKIAEAAEVEGESQAPIDLANAGRATAISEITDGDLSAKGKSIVVKAAEDGKPTAFLE